MSDPYRTPMEKALGQDATGRGESYIQPREGAPAPLPAAPAATKVLDPEVARLLRFFEFAHLPPHLRAISKPFCDLARSATADLPGGPETVAALRKLLESKDCAVRALLEVKQ